MPSIGIYLLFVFSDRYGECLIGLFIIKTILEVKSNTLFVNLLVCLVVDNYIL